MTPWLLRLVGLAMMLTALAIPLSRAPDRPAASLVARWAPPPSDFIDLDGQLVHLRDVGSWTDPAPIVLIHGTGASLHTWEGWARRLSTQRRVITFDLPGFGLSGPRADRRYSAELDAGFVLALLDRLQVRRFVIGGNSLGGEVAWRVALKAPARVDRLVLVDATGPAFEPEQVPLGFRLARLPGLRWLSEELLPRAMVEASVRSVYGDPAKATDAVVDRYFELALREGNRRALIDRFAQWAPPGPDADAQIARLAVPTLLLWGERDRLVPPSVGETFARLVKGSTLVRLPGLGHVPQEEDPDRSVAPVEAFLAASR